MGAQLKTQSSFQRKKTTQNWVGSTIQSNPIDA
uniref:Uncharacterized protein n=1 Tax=Arundo donax TaxID=35708 RepID=A0A0A9E540_ARUDO